jgi:hypothetical protein
MFSRPVRGSQILARLPKRTVVTSMGRVGTFYKVEAPNGKVGYVTIGQLSPNPPDW